MDNRERRNDFIEGLKFVNDNHENLKRQEYKIKKEEAERAYRKAQEQRKKQVRSKRAKKRLAWILAGGIAITAIGFVAHSTHESREQKEQAIVEMQETGKGMAQAGLSEKTMLAIEDFEELFEQESKQELSEEEILNKISGMKVLAVDVIEERMANLTGTNKEDISYEADYDRGEFNASVIVKGENDIDETCYTTKGLAKKGPHIPAEFRKVLENLDGQYENLSSKLENGEITKKDALAKLAKMYPAIKDLAETNLIIARDGDVVSVELEQQKDTAKDSGFEIGD